MNLEIIVFILRIVGGLLLLSFLLAICLMLWHDYNAVNDEVITRTYRRGRLYRLDGDEAIPMKREYPLLALNTFGRSLTNSVCLDDAFISNHHATLTMRGGQWWLEDRGSSNGTFLNGHRIQAPVVVSTGDVLGIGPIELRIEIE